MMMNLLVLAVTLAVGYVWSTRGFFSALLHLGCAVTGGAVAFAVWEPVAYALLGTGSFLGDAGWCLGLLLPFAIVTGGLSAAVNAIIRGNAKCEPVVDIIGGAVCGGGIGLISAGMIAISLSWLPSQAGLMGYNPVEQDNSGAPVRTNGLWIPADRLVAMMYLHASERAFGSGTSLARYYPDLPDRGHIMKIGPEDAELKFAARPGDVQLVGRYTLNETGTMSVADMTKDTFDDRPQKIKDFSGSEVTSGQYQVEGYVIIPKAGLRESNGQVVFGNGHLTLLAVDSAGDAQTYQPFAMISQAKGDTPAAGHWRFDGKGVFLGSVGGAANPPMAFEFMVPKGVKPIALYVKGVRLNLNEGDETEIKPKSTFAKYSNIRGRDDAIKNRSLLAGSATAIGNELIVSSATQWKSNNQNAGTMLLVTNQINLMLNKGNLRGLSADDKNMITDGTAEFFKNEVVDRGGDKGLIVNKVLVDPTTVIVQVNVTPGGDFDILKGIAATTEGQPTMVDDLAQPQRHQCVGYVYEDAGKLKVRYTPGQPVVSKDELPSLTKSRADQKLWLLFRCSLGVKLKYFAIGDTAVKELSPVVKLESSQVGK